MTGPILMGKKDTFLDWKEFDRRAISALGFIPRKYNGACQRLSRTELGKLGFVFAAGWVKPDPVYAE